MLNMTRLPIDTRRRVSLAKLLPKGNNIHSVKAYKEGNKIILEPMAEIPAYEAWLHENPKALKSIQKGIKEAKEGKLRDRQSYAEFADDEI
jgi:hypothetical protein